MKNGTLESQNSQHEKKHILNKIQLLIFSLLVITTVTVGGTVAYLTTKTESVVNTFKPSQVSCSVDEVFKNNVKKKVNVTNESDIDAYIRVKLVTYRVNEAGNHIGGEATVPPFTPGTNWKLHGGYYYYTLPVAPGEKPDFDLIDENGIELRGSYDDADGGKQVIEVMAEAIQSEPAKAVGEAWGVTITLGNVADYSTN